MPKTLTEKIYKYVHELTYSGYDKDTAKDFGEYLLSLVALTDKIDGYMKTDADGNYPKLGNREIRSLQEDYNKTIAAGNAFLETAGKDSHKRAFNYVIGKINETLTSEMVELSNVLTTAETDMKTISDKAGTINVDITGKEVSYEGGQQSARMPLTFKDNNGKEVNGYFTEVSKFNFSKDLAELIDKCSNGNKDYKEAFYEMLGDSKIMDDYAYGKGSEKYLKKQMQLKQDKKLTFVFQHELNHISGDGLDFYKLNEEPEFTVAMFKFLKGLAGVKTKRGILTGDAGVKEGNTLENRNAAMTAMADLLGVPDIIARSVKMNVKNGDEEISGVFMEKAKGFDLNKITDADEIAEFKNKNVTECVSGNYKKQLSDIQVLDFICGNVDRHTGNMLYSTEKDSSGKMILSGIQGIDNDCSFGVIEFDRMLNGCNRMKGLKNINRMSKGMADHIKSLTPEILKTTLRPYDLKPYQVEACIDRLKMVQAELSRQTQYTNGIKIVADDEWDKEKVDYKNEQNLLATTTRNFSNNIKFSIEENIAEKKEKEDLAKIHSDFAEKGGSVAEGRIYTKEVDEIEEADNNKKIDMKALSKRLEFVKKGRFLGSRAFDRMEKVYADLTIEDLKATCFQTPAKIKKLTEKYKLLLKRTDEYIAKKEKEELDDLRKGKAPSQYAVNRTDFARQLKKFTENRLKAFEINLKNREGVVNDVKTQLTGNINNANKLIETIANEPASKEKDAFEKELETSKNVNMTLIKSINEHADNISNDKLSEMVSPTNQEKMVEKTEELLNASAENVNKSEVDKNAVKEDAKESVGISMS